jgi:hypothetical protein
MVDVTIAELEAWSMRSGTSVDLGEMQVLLALCRDHLDLTAPQELSGGDLRHLLLDVYPQTVLTSGADAAAVPTARCLLEFLDATNRLPARTLQHLKRELDDVEPLFAGAVDDPSRWGPARRLTEAMVADGVDVSDAVALQGWISDFNDSPAQERYELTGGPWLDADDGQMPSLPPVRLAPVEDLARRAREARRLHDIRRLALWVTSTPDGSRQVTATGVLRRADARAAIDDLGLVPPERCGGPAWPRSAADVHELHDRWCLAVESGMLRPVGAWALPGPARDVPESGSDDALLELWYQAFCWMIDRPEGGPVRTDVAESVIAEQIPELLVLLYGAEQPVVVDELMDELARDAWFATGDDDDPGWNRALARALRTGFTELSADLGVVDVDGERVALSALGTWGMRRRLTAEGYEAPAVGALAGSPAADLLDGIGGYSEDAAADEITTWLARRDPLTAAEELVAAARDATPVRRQMAFALLDQVPGAAEPIVRAALDEHDLRPYAAVWLANRELEPVVETSVEETSWLLIDMGAALIDTGDPAYLAEQLGLEIPAGELARRVEDLWRVEHPRAADVLTAIGDHHPDQTVAKAARKASFRARSRALA